MRYGIISDIHSNLPALEKALEELEDAAVGGYICLGDIVGYGPWPNECCDILRQMACVFVRGNHDQAAVSPGIELWFNTAACACILWTREVLTEENSEFLKTLRPHEIVQSITLCHGSVPDQDFYTTSQADAMCSFEATTTALTLFGHTHYAEWFSLAAESELPTQNVLPDGGSFQLQPETSYLVNVGSVGQPRDGNPDAAYGLYDDQTGVVEFHRFSYDIDKVQQRIREVGLPERMASRLGLGI